MKMSIYLVASDATGEEAVEQIAFCLEQLVNWSNEMFDCLSNRLKNVGGRTVRLEREVEQIGSKIDQIRVMNNVIEITAPGKFIRMEGRCRYKVLEKVSAASGNAWRTTAKKCKYSSEESKGIVTVLGEKQKFYRFTERRRKPRLDMQIYDKLHSVADFLLFNTTTNVYMNDRFVDPFDNVKAELHVESQCIVQHAASVTDDSTLAVKVKQKTDPLLYQPEFGLLQNFRLPELLFDSASLHNNSPVVERSRRVDVESQDVSTLQKVTSREEGATEPVLLPMKDTGKMASLTLIGSHFSTTGTTEERETLSEEVKDRASNSAEYENEKSESVRVVDSDRRIIPPAPPPPPPPPPPLSVPQIAAQITTSRALNEVVTFGGDRANLMEAIRRAGGAKGAKLRSVRKKEELLAEDASALPKRNVTAAPPSVDLMSSLTKALEQRRKGIFGKKPEHKEPMKCSGLSEGAFAHMSARIPPPPSREENEENDGADKYDDCDWE